MLHPILGRIEDETGQNMVWITQPLKIGSFDYISKIEAWTSGGPPKEKQLNAMVKMMNSTSEYRLMVSTIMREHYLKYVRPVYLATIGDPRYAQKLRKENIPEIYEPNEIWKLITGFNMLMIDENGDENLGFSTKFDLDHEFSIRFRGGCLYEVMMDG